MIRGQKPVSQTSQRKSVRSQDSWSSSQGSQLDVLNNVPNPANISLQDLMLEAYCSIGAPDAMYGCGAGRLADIDKRLAVYAVRYFAVININKNTTLETIYYHVNIKYLLIAWRKCLI